MLNRKQLLKSETVSELIGSTTAQSPAHPRKTRQFSGLLPAREQCVLHCFSSPLSSQLTSAAAFFLLAFSFFSLGNLSLIHIYLTLTFVSISCFSSSSFSCHFGRIVKFVLTHRSVLKSELPCTLLSLFSCSVVFWLFATLWTTASQASLSFTISWSLLKLTSIESVMPSNHLILCLPLLRQAVSHNLNFLWKSGTTIVLFFYRIVRKIGSKKICKFLVHNFMLN